MTPLRPIPEGFAEVVNDFTIKQLCVKFGAGRETVIRWLAECPVKRTLMKGGKDIVEMPADFPVVQAGRTVMELCAHYGRNKHVVRRWLADLGISRSEVRRAKRVVKIVTPTRSVHPITAPLDKTQRDVSPAGIAADDLRRDRWVVYRCDPDGRANPAGTHWMCGRVILTSDELMERAERARRRMAA